MNGHPTAFRTIPPPSGFAPKAPVYPVPQLVPTIDVLIAEDCELARIGLKFTLEKLNHVRIVGLAEDGLRAVSKAYALHPNIILMDIAMPKMDGISATCKLKAELPKIKIIILTSQINPREVYAAWNAGADAYCSKDIKVDCLEEVIQSVMQGKRWLDPAVTHLFEGIIPSFKISSRVDTTSHLNSLLTDKEIQILRVLSRPKKIEDIVNIVHESGEAVEDSITSILYKLAVNNLTDALLKAMQMGLIQDPKAEYPHNLQQLLYPEGLLESISRLE